MVYLCAFFFFFRHLKNPSSNLEMNQNKVPGKVSSFLICFMIFPPLTSGCLLGIGSLGILEIQGYLLWDQYLKFSNLVLLYLLFHLLTSEWFHTFLLQMSYYDYISMKLFLILCLVMHTLNMSGMMFITDVSDGYFWIVQCWNLNWFPSVLFSFYFLTFK